MTAHPPTPQGSADRAEELRDIAERLLDMAEVRVDRYDHGGARVWREDEGGLRDLVLDLYGPAERRDAILEALKRFPRLVLEREAEKAELERARGELNAEHEASEIRSEELARLREERDSILRLLQGAGVPLDDGLIQAIDWLVSTRPQPQEAREGQEGSDG